MPPSIRRLWPAIALVGLLAVGFVSVAADSGKPIAAVALIVLGAVLNFVGVTRILNPGWRATTWWREHPIVRFAFSWKSSTARPNPWAERMSGLYEIACGTVFIVAGIAVL